MRNERARAQTPASIGGLARLQRSGRFSEYPIAPVEGELPVTTDLAKSLEKQYEKADLHELINAPVSAVAGVSDDDADLWQSAYRIKTAGDLGHHKYSRAAQALTEPTSSRSNAS